jgi:hypothetical protein
MAISEAVVGIIGAAIGAGGAVIAQVTTGAFTSRRERVRLNWEVAKQEREWGLHTEERFLSVKQELYVGYALICNGFLSYIYLLTEHSDDEPSEKRRLEKQREAFPDVSGLERLRQTIELMAPKGVYEYVDKSSATLIKVANAVAVPGASISERRKLNSQAIRECMEMRDAMRADLQGVEDRLRQAKAKDVDASAGTTPTHHHWWQRADLPANSLARTEIERSAFESFLVVDQPQSVAVI